MEDVADSQVYRLFLSSTNGFSGLISNSDKYNSSWQVDYDSLFNGENYKFKNCRLRYKLRSNPITSLGHITGFGTLVINGLSSQNNSKNTSGLVADNIIPSASTTHGWYDLTTMDEIGIDIIVPYGLSTINPQFWDLSFGSKDSLNPPQFITNFTATYTLILSFELYNPK